jgi:large subunit ribosomal protein L5
MRLKNYYKNILAEDILLKLNCKPEEIKSAQTPNLTIHLSSSAAVENKVELLPLILILEVITGQRAQNTRAKNSLSNYRLKKGMDMGLKVKLHGEKA